MKRLVLALTVMASLALASAPSWAATVATVPLGGLPGGTNPVSDEKKGTDASGDIDYTFSLADASQITVLSGGPVSGHSGADTTGISNISLKLLDSTSATIATAAGVSSFGQWIVGFDDVLGPGSYTLQIFFTKSATRTLFDITTTVTTNLASQTPIPAAGLLLVTAIGGLGGLGLWRKRGGSAV